MTWIRVCEGNRHYGRTIRLTLQNISDIGYAFEMEMTVEEENPDSPMSGIYEIPGEPALVINGVPPVCTSDDGSLFPCEVVGNIDSKLDEFLGDWLDGREVQKLFGGRVYNGKVTKFDKESGWYRVDYEDGDFEDLEWHELQEVLLPLDVTIPLKTLASKVIKMRQKHERKVGRSATKVKIHQHKELQSGVEKMEA
ncbi:hypothetical protein L6452_11392 [Arctium lappa]|uniref:Uncharacterized protein n=1 Tax=Arctium lappa TaxID=4217 RepID=A0ACB9DPA3_ARCLA|nr:hypothetical protein L6452_11392 [Arctium lappa]